jgi:LPXTG-motif cell wall-anchored protein
MKNKLLILSLFIGTFFLTTSSALADTYNNACPYGAGTFGVGGCLAAVTGKLPNTGVNLYWITTLVLFALAGLGLLKAGLHLRKTELSFHS